MEISWYTNSSATVPPSATLILLVSSERVGRETVYALRPEPLEDAAAWIERVGADWDRRLDALRRSLDR